MEICTVTEIVAPAQVVWDILSDLEHYSDWNPFTYHAEGELKIGAELRFNVRFPDNSEVVTRHIICALNPSRELSWRRTNVPLLLWTERRQIIEQVGETRLNLVNREFAWGPLSPLVSWFYGKRIEGGLRACAEAVKKRAEGR